MQWSELDDLTFEKLFNEMEYFFSCFEYWLNLYEKEELFSGEDIVDEELNEATKTIPRVNMIRG